MNNEKEQILHNKYIWFQLDSKQMLLYSVIAGLFLILLVWSVFFPYYNLKFNLTGIWSLHQINPFMLIIDFSPLVFYKIISFIKSNEATKQQLEDQINEKSIIINKNAQFAKQIGEGNFILTPDKIDKNDQLATALLLMQENLINNQKNEEEKKWVSNGKDLISDILRQHDNINILAYDVLVSLIKYTDFIQGAFYSFNETTNLLENIATYSYNRQKYINQNFKIGYGLIGQAAYEKEIIYRTEIPDDYVTLSSGILGDKKPCSLIILPLVADGKIQGVIEIASVHVKIDSATLKLVIKLGNIIGQTIFILKSNTKTQDLLKESQIKTQELRENEKKIKQNADEIESTKNALEKSYIDLEKNIKIVQSSEKKIHSILENTSEVISIYNKLGELKYESPSVKNILGTLSNTGLGMNTIHTSAINKVKEAISFVVKYPYKTQTFIYKYTKTDNSIIWLETTARNLLDNHAIEGIIFNTRDITINKLAEHEHLMKAKMQALSENSPDMILRLDLLGNVLYVNPIFEKHTGISTKKILNRSIHEVSLQEDLHQFINECIIKIIQTKVKLETESTILDVNKNEMISQVNVIPEFNEDKELETLLFVAHNITDRKKIEIEIHEKNKKINESISYSRKIQKSLLPTIRTIREVLPKSFMLYKPRDIVSGDFPWMFCKGDDIYIAAVDCTGHGVPGALLTFIGHFILNHVVDSPQDFSAAEILNQLHKNVRTTLRQDEKNSDSRDGMDIALCKINLVKKELEYSGAHRSLYYVKNNNLIEYKGDRKAIGGIPLLKKQEKDFTNHLITFEQNDKIFFFSDGLPDQDGGPYGEKYSSKRIREIIVNNPDFSMMKFDNYFTKDLTEWKGSFNQLDDILLIGIEF